MECRHCGEYLSDDVDDLGARCPRCREPLYERTAAQRRRGEPAAGGAVCALHPGSPSVGTCQRCGNYLCGVCRTRWYERALCVACVERALASQEARPEDVRAHRRQAVLALVFGVVSWALVLVGGLCFLGASGGGPKVGLVLFAGLLTLASILPALFGVGQGAAAVRARGDRMILATCGLLLSGIHLGVVLGLLAFSTIIG